MYKPYLKRIQQASPDLLRWSLIGSASLMLLCAIVLAVLSISNWGQHTQAGGKAVVSVKPDEVTGKLIAARANTAQGKAEPEASAEATSADPNLPLHERTATAVDNFVSTYGKGVETIDKATVLEAIRAKAGQYKDAKTAAEFAQGLAATMEKALADPKVIKMVELPAQADTPHEAASGPVAEPADAGAAPDAAQALPFRESPIGIVNEVMATYSRLFVERLEKKEHDQARAEADDSARNAKALTQICFAAGALGVFLLLVIVSIGLTIEKKLKALTPVSIPVSETVRKPV